MVRRTDCGRVVAAFQGKHGNGLAVPHPIVKLPFDGPLSASTGDRFPGYTPTCTASQKNSTVMYSDHKWQFYAWNVPIFQELLPVPWPSIL